MSLITTGLLGVQELQILTSPSGLQLDEEQRKALMAWLAKAPTGAKVTITVTLRTARDLIIDPALLNARIAVVVRPCV